MYMVIDLKSFYAACECIERNLDMFKVPLVVGDKSRSKNSICLAASPAAKKLGISSRTRVQDIDSSLNVIFAKPRMKLYIDYSTKVYECYLHFFSKDDIHVYSIDECFIELSSYKQIYKDWELLAKEIQQYVYKKLKLIVTVGIGENMFLAKVALDIISKKAATFIGYLDKKLFKEKIWPISDLTSIWSIGYGIERRLHKLGIFNVGDIAQTPKEILQKEFGVIGLELYDHANGIDETTIYEAKNVVIKSKSISEGQVLFKDYTKEQGLVVLVEMIDVLTLKLVSRNLVTKGISLYIGYSKNLGGVTKSKKLIAYTDDYKELLKQFKQIYIDCVSDIPIRRICIGAYYLSNNKFNQLSFFSDMNNKNFSLFKSISSLKNKYGKNAVIKAISLDENGNQIQRNKYIGGHCE